MSGRITTVSKPPKLERKKRVAAYARVSSGKDAITATLSREIATGSMQASMPMKPRPARRIPERIFKDLLPTAMPEKLIW